MYPARNAGAKKCKIGLNKAKDGAAFSVIQDRNIIFVDGNLYEVTCSMTTVLRFSGGVMPAGKKSREVAKPKKEESNANKHSGKNTHGGKARKIKRKTLPRSFGNICLTGTAALNSGRGY